MSEQNSQGLNLDNVDAIVLLDKSGSMDEKLKGTITRWQIGQESIGALAAELAKHDDDGITVVPFGPDYAIEDGVTPETVAQVFARYSPGGGTYLAPALQAVINKFIPATAEVKDSPRQVARQVLAATQPAPKKGSLGMFGGTPEPVYDTVYHPAVHKVKTGNYLR